eukprot:2037772-Rhodomonas_salina.1
MLRPGKPTGPRFGGQVAASLCSYAPATPYPVLTRASVLRTSPVRGPTCPVLAEILGYQRSTDGDCGVPCAVLTEIV